MADVLVGVETSDDAGAVRLPSGEALLATVDFITPICDDAETFGRISAANAVSDIYAMGGRPVAALSVACYPSRRWPVSLLGEMLRGGAETLGAAGVPVIGGHTVEDDEMKLGYAVMGLADPARLWRNSGAVPGDEIVLTKRLGTGIVAAAARAGRTGPWWDAAQAQMCELSAPVVSALEGQEVHAATDVTGFGLVGHAAEMARGSGVTLRFRADALPVLDGALDLAGEGYRTRGRKPNDAYAQPWRAEPGVDARLVDVACDPQTSGGLLLAVPAGSDALSRLESAGVRACVVGAVEERGTDVVVLA